MTQDEIIRMAREAGFVVTIHGESNGFTTLESRFNPDKLGDFAALVAAHEREACAKVCDEIAISNWDAYKGRIEPIDRDKLYNPHIEGMSDGADECAAAIRARGNNK